MSGVPMTRRWFSVREATEITGLSRDTIMRLCRQGRLKYSRPTPRSTRILAESLENLMRVLN
ncbi:helix-turn-helix domain-containing protein [Bifidobacterium tibiigranuli]|jgi:excisionase family DNA binding protein|uniref:helix-turn-helix domain-containing protein n=2 Tax=Bifidobacterium tibiigranuli TaxID=2172043 RepID=UPI0034C5CDE6